MDSVRDEVEALIGSLGALSPLGEVLAATSLRLADNIDHPARNERGEASMVSSPANALRAALADLMTKGRADDDDGDASGWANIAASAGATPIRDGAAGGASDSRRRGRGGRPSAG